MLWLLVLTCSLLAGTSEQGDASTEVIGVLGEAAIFPLESPSPIRSAVWAGNELLLANLELGPPCQLEPGEAHAGQGMTVSPDCSSLTLRDLRQEDAGMYMALVATVDHHLFTQNVTLKVYKRLSEADLEVFCGKEILGDGNQTLHLICSAGRWEDGVGFGWTSAAPNGSISSSEKALALLSKPQGGDLNVTCTAENPVGRASRTVSLKQACTGLYTEGKTPKEVIGILRGSATFPLDGPFDRVLWLRNGAQVAALSRGPPCQLAVFGAYWKREVTAPQDCGSLTVGGLRQEDAVGYAALMLSHGKAIRRQAFALQLYKPLSEADLQVVCAKDPLSGGKNMFRLSCSAGPWGAGLELRWAPPSETGVLFSPEEPLLVLHRPQEQEGNVTCTAKNPVSRASRTVSLKQACAGLPEEVAGVLGGSASFALEGPSPSSKVLWFRSQVLLASMRRAPAPCQLSLFGAYQGRGASVSQDCGSLTLRGLRREDSAQYKAQMQDGAGRPVGSRTFTLKVYNRLSEADLDVACAQETLRDGTKMLRLNCSVGQWEDGVEFSWSSPSNAGLFSSAEKSLLVLYKPQEAEANVTCVAENPVGRASRTVSLRQACDGNAGCSSNLTGLATGLSLAALVVAKVVVCACVFTKWPPCRQKRGRLRSPSSLAAAQEEEGVC